MLSSMLDTSGAGVRGTADPGLACGWLTWGCMAQTAVATVCCALSLCQAHKYSWFMPLNTQDALSVWQMRLRG